MKCDQDDNCLAWVGDVSVAVEGKVEGDAVERGEVDRLLGAAARRLELGPGPGGVHTRLARGLVRGVAQELVHAREEVRVQQAVLHGRRRGVLLLLRWMKSGVGLHQCNSLFGISVGCFLCIWGWTKHSFSNF